MILDGRGIVDEALLTETGSGGMLRDGYLSERPLETYLEDAERPRIAFASGHRGVVQCTSEEETVHEPDSGYRALVALTGRRAVIVVGNADGDRSFEVSFNEVVDVESDEGFRRSQVTLRTEGGDAWRLYPEGIDTGEVREYLVAAADVWERFETRLSAARNALDVAASARADGDFEGAEEACDQAESALSEGESVHAEFDESVAVMERRLESIRSDCLEERRELVRDCVRSRVERAERRWREGAYERAVDDYERARERLESFVGRDLPERAATPIREDLAAIDRNRKRLSAAPLRRALALERAAERVDDPEAAIERWREAYEGFRTVLELDWGRERSRFDGDTDAIRERLAAAVRRQLGARRRAADRRFRDADQLAGNGQYDAARAAFSDAVDHLERAISTARQLAPSEVDSLQDRLADVESRIDSLPESGQDEPEDAVSENSDDTMETDGDDEVDDSNEGPEGIRRSDDGRSENGTATAPGGVDTADNDGTDPGTEENAPGPENGDEPATGMTARERSDGIDPTIRSMTDGTEASAGSSERGASPERYVDELRTLDEERIKETAVGVWRGLGWSTDRIEEGEADSIARRSDEAGPMLLFVRCQGVPLGARGVRRCEHAASDCEEDPAPVMVTTDPVDPSAFEAAMLGDITLVDAPRLDELARSTGVHPAIDADSVPDRRS